jgi:hypothetical protein
MPSTQTRGSESEMCGHHDCNHHDQDIGDRQPTALSSPVERRGLMKLASPPGLQPRGSFGATADRLQRPYADPEKPALPPSDMKLDLPRTALVVTDPQVDFLSPKGVTWGVVGKSVEKQGTVANIGRLFKAAKTAGITVAVSPHYYYPTDKGWQFEGALEKLMHKIGMFDRKGPYSLEGFEGSGADFMPEYKPYILDNKRS